VEYLIISIFARILLGNNFFRELRCCFSRSALFVRFTRLQLRVFPERSGNYVAAFLVPLSSFALLGCSSVFPLTLDKDISGVKTQTPIFQIDSLLSTFNNHQSITGIQHSIQ